MSKSAQPPARPDAILAVRLPADLRDALRSEAEAHQRSMSGQVRWLVEQSLTHDHDGTGQYDPETLRRSEAA